jgi:hypothetical protein
VNHAAQNVAPQSVSGAPGAPASPREGDRPQSAAALAPSTSARLASLGSQISQLPPLLRVGLLAALVIGGYSLFNATTWKWARDTESEAARYEVELEKANRRPLVDRQLRDVVLAHGEVRLPAREADGALAMAETVNEVLKKHKEATKIADQARAATRLPGVGLGAVLGPAGKAAKVTRELRFEAPPHVASSIIKELESSPHIDAISAVRMSVSSDAKGVNVVEVELTLEAWVTAEDRSRSKTS